MAMASMPPACAATELVAKGRESAAVLTAILGELPAAAVGAGATLTPHGLRDLAEQILRCCDRALAALHSDTGTGTEEAASNSRKRKPEQDGSLAAPPAATGSKRTRMSRGERATRVEKKGTMEDGFIWRKYGQKDINGSNYPRLYFRCTYKDDRGCLARRQVQQSDIEPSVYLITYFDEHTCCLHDDAVEEPAPFVINFGLSSAGDGQPSGSPWPSSDDDGPVETMHTSPMCSSPPEEQSQKANTCNVAEFIVEQSTPVREPSVMTLPEWEWDPMDGCLGWGWEIGNGESSIDIDDFFVRYDLDYIDLV